MRRYDHVTFAVVDLHWLHVPEHVCFKVAALVNLCLNGLAPRYLAAALHRAAGVDTWRRLRPASADGDLLFYSALSRRLNGRQFISGRRTASLERFAVDNSFSPVVGFI